MPRLKCICPIYCKYCGAKRKRDSVGHYCPTKNCQWHHGFPTCLPIPKKKTQRCPPPSPKRKVDMWIIECPKCHEKRPMKEFQPSCADECTCPKCEEFFTIEWPEDEQDEDE